MQLRTLINWKLFFTLLIAAILSNIALLPYAISLQGEMLKLIPIPLPVLLLLSVLQGAVLFAILIFIGLKLSARVGLGLPLLEHYFENKTLPLNFKSIVKNSVLLGLLTGIVIIILDVLFNSFGVHLSGEISPPIWQGFLASFYGGIAEEILLRLFFMTFIVWLISKLTRSNSEIIHNNTAMGVAIFIAALLFGIGHLPATAALVELTPLVIIRALLLNGIGGIVFGWLYWKKGLEAAIIAHFSADIILHVIFPLFVSI